MKYLNSYFFWYNKSQRNGILFLLLLIVLFQGIYLFINFFSDNLQDVNNEKILAFEKKIDSLKCIKVKNRKTKIYPFNPNYITDFKGYQLGMSTDEIDRLHNFRKQNKWINSISDFKLVTKVSDSVLTKISPYFKFPDWVIKKKRSNNKDLSFQQKKKFQLKDSQPNKIISTVNINDATDKDFETITGIGEVLSKRIIKYRSKLQGFSYQSQLYEVWGLDKKVAKKVLEIFKIVEKPNIKKINVNVASFKEVLSNPYIDYELCKKIFDYRDEIAEFQDISELKNINGFPVNKYDRIILYLEAK